VERQAGQRAGGQRDHPLAYRLGKSRLRGVRGLPGRPVRAVGVGDRRSHLSSVAEWTVIPQQYRLPVPETYVQQTFDALIDDPLARSLRETTFVVVDLETTGGTPDSLGITEIGAVKIRGGEELAEFATLVNPGQPVPPFITVLTGITEAML